MTRLSDFGILTLIFHLLYISTIQFLSYVYGPTKTYQKIGIFSDPHCVRTVLVVHIATFHTTVKHTRRTSNALVTWRTGGAPLSSCCMAVLAYVSRIICRTFHQIRHTRHPSISLDILGVESLLWDSRVRKQPAGLKYLILSNSLAVSSLWN